MNLPNILTLSRIVAIPVIIFLFLTGNPVAQWFAFALYVIAAITDFFDGALARRMNAVSPLGRMLDPIADKLLVGALLIAFAFAGSFTIGLTWAAIAIMMREIAVSGLREHLGSEGVTVHVTAIAKYKTTAQLIALGAMLVVPLVPGLELAAHGLVWLAAVLTIYTGVEYFMKAWPHLSGAKA